MALFFSTLLCSTIQTIMAAVLLFAGSMGTDFLLMQVRKVVPWLRAFGLANSALATAITVWIAQGHTILAALASVVGIVIGVKALTVKPAMDRVASYDANCGQPVPDVKLRYDMRSHPVTEFEAAKYLG